MQGHGPLASVRVVDISERSPAAAIAGMVMNQFGAEVIRVEPKGGDPIRALPATRVWYAGNRSVVMGEDEIANGSWAKLLDSADVVLTTAHPTTDKPSGLLEGMRPDQIRVVLTARPATPEAAGPDPDGLPVYGELLEAELGFQDAMANLFREVHDGPVDHPVYLAWPHAYYGAAWLMLIGSLSALVQRVRTGEGQTVTTSLVDGLAILSSNRWLHADTVPVSKPLSIVPRIDDVKRNIRSRFRTADGWICLHTGPRGSYNRMLEAIGRADLISDETTHTGPGKVMSVEVARELRGYVQELIAGKTTDEIMQLLVPAGVAVMPALPPGEILLTEQAEANALAFTQDGVTRVGRTAIFRRTPTVLGGTAPQAGADADLLNVMRQPPVMPAPAHAPRTEAGPLDGITVVDFGSYIAGPYASRMLADLGATVIKVEEPGGDPMRMPFALFSVCNRGKQDVSLNLKTEAGRSAALGLLARADIATHNMRNGVMERLGLDDATARAANPRLVYVHSSGYGNEGPWAQRPAFEPLHSGLAGLLHRATGDGNAPQMYMSHMDFGGGLAGATAMLAGLYARELTGEGQFIEAPQLAAAMLAMSDVFIEGGRTVETFRLDSAGRGIAPTNALYDTSDGHVVISCNSEAEWRGLGTALGLDGLPTYAEARLESLDGSGTAARVQVALRALPTAKVPATLRAAGVAAAAPRDVSVQDRGSLDRPGAPEIFTTSEHPVHGAVHEVGHTIRFSAATGRHNRPSPEVGQDSWAILGGLGLADEAIDAMIAGGAARALGGPRRTAAE